MSDFVPDMRARPAIVFKSSHYTGGEDIICIPLTSVGEQKLADALDILVKSSTSTNLYKNSYARIRQLRAISYKRIIGERIGRITDPIIQKAIN